MYKHSKAIFLIISISIISGCTNDVKSNYLNVTTTNSSTSALPSDSDTKYYGYVVAIEKRTNENRILIMRNITKNEINQYSTNEIIKKAKSDDSAAWYIIQNDLINKLRIGNLIESTSKDEQMEMNPPVRIASSITIIN